MRHEWKYRAYEAITLLPEAFSLDKERVCCYRKYYAEYFPV